MHPVPPLHFLLFLYLWPLSCIQYKRIVPLRKVRQIVNDALASLDAEFDRLHSAEGRPSIAPERLLRASLLQILFSVRSERQLMEQMQYNLLFRWFVGLGIDDPVWGEGRPDIWSAPLGLDRPRRPRLTGARLSEEESSCPDTAADLTPIFHPAETRDRRWSSRRSAGEATAGLRPVRCCSSPAAKAAGVT